MHTKDILAIICVYAVFVITAMAFNVFASKDGISLQWLIFGMPMLGMLSGAIRSPKEEFTFADIAIFSVGCVIVSLLSVVGNSYWPDRFPDAFAGPVSIAINVPLFGLILAVKYVVAKLGKNRRAG